MPSTCRTRYFLVIIHSIFPQSNRVFNESKTIIWYVYIKCKSISKIPSSWRKKKEVVFFSSTGAHKSKHIRELIEPPPDHPPPQICITVTTVSRSRSRSSTRKFSRRTKLPRTCWTGNLANKCHYIYINYYYVTKLRSSRLLGVFAEMYFTRTVLRAHIDAFI